MKKYLPLFLIFLCSNVFSFDFLEKRYELLLCTEDGKNCKKQTQSLAFKVDVKKSLVIINFYENGVFDSSQSLDRCKVIDSKNWDCFYSYPLQSGKYEVRFNMSNGRLTNDIQTHRYK
jgi:hypothetical protein